jgi:replicative DNA helicase
MTLPDKVPSTANLEHYASLVIDAQTRRAVIERLRAGVEEVASAESGAVLAATIAGDLAGLASTGGTADDHDHGPGLVEHLHQLHEQAQRPDPPTLSTGFLDLDRKLGGGFRPEEGELVVIGGRPGMGKSTLALNMADACVDQGCSAGVISLEMRVSKIRSRRLSARAGVPLARLRDPRGLSQAHSDALYEVAHAVDVLPLRVDDRTALTVDQVWARTVQWHQQAPPDAPLKLVVVDYLQIMGGLGETGSDRASLVGQAAQRLHDLAQELAIVVVLVVQLNRGAESRSEKRPGMSDIRESGGVEQAADMILFPFRPDYYRVQAGDPSAAVDGVERDAEIGVAKQRDGATGIVPVSFVGECVRFEDRAADDVHL